MLSLHDCYSLNNKIHMAKWQINSEVYCHLLTKMLTAQPKLHWKAFICFGNGWDHRMDVNADGIIIAMFISWRYNKINPVHICSCVSKENCLIIFVDAGIRMFSTKRQSVGLELLSTWRGFLIRGRKTEGEQLVLFPSTWKKIAIKYFI